MQQLVDSHEMSFFAQTAFNSKYAHTKDNGNKESWAELAHRVAHSVTQPYMPELSSKVEKSVSRRQFIPGGRYLYAAGRRYPQTNNCFLFNVEDSREGWAGLMSRITNGLMTGGGLGCVYSKLRGEGQVVKGLGGFSTGPIALMQMVNESGRHIMQGGARRSAIWAGLHWNHNDINRFITIKNWRPELVELKLKDFNAAAPLDMTNISVILDDAFFAAYEDAEHPEHKLAHRVYWKVIDQMCETGEPGFSIDVGAHAGEHERNAPVVGDTHVLTKHGYRTVNQIVGVPTTIWTGKQWAPNVVFGRTAVDAPTVKVRMTGGRTICCEPSHPFLVERWRGKGQRRKLQRVERITAKNLQAGDTLHIALPVVKPGVLDIDAYTLGYLYGDGSFTQTDRADVSICTLEKQRCLATLTKSHRLSSVTAGDSRGYTRAYFKTDHDYFNERAKDQFPEELYAESSAVLCSFIAGLFDADGNWDPVQNRIRLSSNYRAFLRHVARALEQVGILAGVSKNGRSTYGQKQTWQLCINSAHNIKFKQLIPTKRLNPDLTDYTAYRRAVVKVVAVTPDAPEDVYCADVKLPEHSFMAEGVIISNCTEVTSRDDNDMCNLASLNMARFASKDEFADAIWQGIGFMLCGTIYSVLPIAEMYDVREKNRRLGLGLMGIHEWLLMRNKSYGPDKELGEWLQIYKDVSDKAAIYWADKLSISRPIARRAVAPTGTISIVAETTSGIEPIFAVAIKRRYLTGRTWKAQYIIDACAQRLIDRGIDPHNIEDAYDLAEDVERRIIFQSWVQSYVDMGISSTINMPSWGSSLNNTHTTKHFGETLFKYLPSLRGITVYPDGARGGQPLNCVKYDEACKYIGTEIVEEGENRKTDVEELGNERACVNGVCGL